MGTVKRSDITGFLYENRDMEYQLDSTPAASPTRVACHVPT
jgi:hypothetical protein